MSATPPGLDVADSFTTLSQQVVHYLRTHTPLSDWSVNRVAAGEQVHLHVEGEGLLATGDRVDWDRSLCQLVVEYDAPPVVPDLTSAPLFRDRPLPGIRSYAGQPIVDTDGEMFGMLCGVGGEALPPDDPGVDADLVALLGRLLGAQLSLARRLETGDLKRRQAEALAQTDSVTGLVNRRGWDAVQADAAVRTSAYGDLVAVIAIDLDEGRSTYEEGGSLEGDLLLQRAALALTEARVGDDVVARYGGDEFAVLVDDVSPRLLGERLRHYREAFAEHDVQASFGWSLVYPGDEPADAALHRAEESVRQDRRERERADAPVVDEAS